MKLKSLQKLAALAIVVGAGLLTAWTVCWSLLLPRLDQVKDFTLVASHPNWLWISTLSLFGLLLLLFGFIGAYSRIYDRAGSIGLVGFISLVSAYLIQLSKVTWEIFIYPVLAAQASAVLRERLLIDSTGVTVFRLAAMGSILLGVVLFTVAMIRSRRFSRASPLLFLVGAILYGVGPMVSVWLAIGGVLVFSAGCVGIGIGLARGGATSTEPASVGDVLSGTG